MLRVCMSAQKPGWCSRSLSVSRSPTAFSPGASSAHTWPDPGNLPVPFLTWTAIRLSSNPSSSHTRCVSQVRRFQWFSVSPKQGFDEVLSFRSLFCLRSQQIKTTKWSSACCMWRTAVVWSSPRLITPAVTSSGACRLFRPWVRSFRRLKQQSITGWCRCSRRWATRAPSPSEFTWPETTPQTSRWGNTPHGLPEVRRFLHSTADG